MAIRRLLKSLLRPLGCVKLSKPSPTPTPFVFDSSEPILKCNDVHEHNGFDYKHWLILVEEPVGSRDEIIHCYVKLVAQILGSEDEARKKIYSVSTKYYFAVGVLVSEAVAYKFKKLPGVLDVIPDGYVLGTKDYDGEPFVDGKAVPYNPKYHAFHFKVEEEKIRVTNMIGKMY